MREWITTRACIDFLTIRMNDTFSYASDVRGGFRSSKDYQAHLRPTAVFGRLDRCMEMLATGAPSTHFPAAGGVALGHRGG